MAKSKGWITGHDPHIGKSDPAGLPQDKVMEQYPRSRSYSGGDLDDTMEDIDRIDSGSEGKMNKYRSYQK